MTRRNAKSRGSIEASALPRTGCTRSPAHGVSTAVTPRAGGVGEHRWQTRHPWRASCLRFPQREFDHDSSLGRDAGRTRSRSKSPWVSPRASWGRTVARHEPRRVPARHRRAGVRRARCRASSGCPRSTEARLEADRPGSRSRGTRVIAGDRLADRRHRQAGQASAEPGPGRDRMPRRRRAASARSTALSAAPRPRGAARRRPRQAVLHHATPLELLLQPLVVRRAKVREGEF